MAAAKTKSIDEIDDIGEMFEAMAALDISSKGLQTLQDMKDRVKITIDQSSKSPSWSAGQVRIAIIIQNFSLSFARCTV